MKEFMRQFLIRLFTVDSSHKKMEPAWRPLVLYFLDAIEFDGCEYDCILPEVLLGDGGKRADFLMHNKTKGSLEIWELMESTENCGV